MHQVWRLSEYCEGNLGVCFTDDGLFLGRTPLIERQGARFAVRGHSEIERRLSRAYGMDVAVDRLLSGLATVATALNANDPGLARTAAVHLRIPDLPDQTARDRLEAEDILVKSIDRDFEPLALGAAPPNPGSAADGNASFLFESAARIHKASPRRPEASGLAGRNGRRSRRTISPKGFLRTHAKSQKPHRPAGVTDGPARWPARRS